MQPKSVPVSESIHRQLLDISERTGKSVGEIVAFALDQHLRSEFFRLCDEGYAGLRADPEAWAEYQADLKEWDGVLMDGLNDDEVWLPDGTCVLTSKPGDESCPTPTEERSGSPTSGPASDANNKVSGR